MVFWETYMEQLFSETKGSIYCIVQIFIWEICLLAEVVQNSNDGIVRKLFMTLWLFLKLCLYNRVFLGRSTTVKCSIMMVVILLVVCATFDGLFTEYVCVGLKFESSLWMTGHSANYALLLYFGIFWMFLQAVVFSQR